MLIAVLANEVQREEVMKKGVPGETTIEWVNSLENLVNRQADAYADLLFEPVRKRIELLSTLLPKPVIIDSVNATCADVRGPFIRIIGWEGFISRHLIEVAVENAGQDTEVRTLFTALGWSYRRVSDQPGLIAARIIAMIINEAYFALEEGVSTRDEIDIAMKTGTNYPYGPFEWGKKIGIKNVHSLLARLTENHPRYQPASLLAQEAIRE